MSGLYRVTRRDFLRYTGVGAGALVFGFSMAPEEAEASLNLKEILHKGIQVNPFVAIKLNGDIVVITHRPEMGQGIRSSLAAVLADELGADINRVSLYQADADGPAYAIENPNKAANPAARPSYLIPEEVTQFADSSRSMALYFTAMRAVGAGFRLVFTRAAAKKWGVKVEECEVRDHRVHLKNGDKRSIDFRWLLLESKKEAVPTAIEAQAALKTPDQWTYIGKRNMPFHDAHDMVTGKAVYCGDVDTHRPGLLTAMVVRCPVANGEVKSYDDSAARKVPGVVDVIKIRLAPTLAAGGVGAGFIPHAGVAVVAENTWAAWRGRRALKVEWDLTGPAAAFNAGYDSQAFRGELEASTRNAGKLCRDRGDVDAAFGVAAQVVDADYYVPHLAQAPMEPPVAIALYEGDKWEIWSSTQGPEFTQHFVGLAMLEPNPVNWLLWNVTDPTEVKESEQAEVSGFNDELARVLQTSVPELYKRRDELKKRVREKVTVHSTLLGGGFGRKSKCDYAIEAAFIARAHPGRPVRVQWTREDDIQFSYYNSVSHQRLKAGLDAGGATTALQQRSAFTSFFATLFPPPAAVPEPFRPVFTKARSSYHSGGEYPYGSAIERAHSLEDMMLDAKNVRIENCPAQNHIRCGWMRSVANIYHVFATGSFAGELALAAGRDPKDYLLELIGEGRLLDVEAEGAKEFDNNGFPILKWVGNPPVLPPYPPDTRRLRAVVERVAKEVGWDDKVRRYKQMKGRGLGIAATRAFLSYVAIVVDVSLNEANELTVNEIHGALDCGIAVNPDRCLAQMEGGMLYGLSYALMGEISVKNGAVEQGNFDTYPVLRIHQVPKKIAAYFVEPSAASIQDAGGQLNPTGVGEPPTPAVAPALANAIVAAGGPRIREMPFNKFVTVP